MAVTPGSAEEKAIVNSRLRKKYPQMYTKEWREAVGKAKKKKVNHNPDPSKLSKSETNRYEKRKSRRQLERESLQSALTGDEIKRLIGR